MPSKFLNLDTDPTLSSNSDYLVSSQKAIKTYVGTKQDKLSDAQIAAVDSGITAEKVSNYDDYDSTKADKATTLEGYGITNAYTKTEIDNMVFGDVSEVLKNYVKKNEIGTMAAEDTSSYLTKTEVNTALELKADKTDLNSLATKQSVDDLTVVVNGKANKSELNNYATKQSVTDLTATVANKADTTIVNNALALKADKTELEGLAKTSDLGTMAFKNVNDYLTKTEVNTALSGKVDTTTLVNYAKKADVDTELAKKANSADVYTKTEVANALADKADKATSLSGYGIADAYTKGETDNAISTAVSTKANSADVYTKDEVDGLVSSAMHYKGSVATYNDLPTNAKIGDLYNVEDTGHNYAWNGTEWDVMSGVFDLSEYAKKEYVDTEVDKKADKTTVNALSAVVDTKAAQSDLNITNQEVAKKANKSDLGTMAAKNAADYSTTAETNAALALKADKTELNDYAKKVDVYTKTEVDTALDGKLDNAALDEYTKTNDLGSMAFESATDYSTTAEITVELDKKANVEDLADYAKTASINTLLTLKADKATVYTKAEVNTALEDKVNKVSTPDVVYGTNDKGEQVTYGKDSFGQVDDVKINGTSVVTDRVASLTVDGTPTAGSLNLITSGAVYAAMGGSGEGPSYVAGEGIEISNGVISTTATTLHKQLNTTVAVSEFVEDTRYGPYNYRADVAVEGITENDYPFVSFTIEETLLSNYAPFAESGNGYVSIWCEELPETDLVIPLITYE